MKTGGRHRKQKTRVLKIQYREALKLDTGGQTVIGKIETATYVH
jgi:hypothetical protein